jgi:hypothetical protein
MRSYGKCVCPKNEELVNGFCKCQPGMTRDKYTGRCGCPRFEELVGMVYIVLLW